MKRKLIAFTMTLALVLTALSATGVNAHFVEIESKNARTADRTDWFGVEASGTGSVVTQRNSAQQGEVVFNDYTGKVGDQRLITASQDVTRSVDLDWFSVTADATNIYFLAKVERYQGIQQTPPIELMISIDTNHTNGAGTLPLPNTAGISVTNDAAWEFVVDTKFSTGNMGVASGTTTIYTSGGAANGSSCGNVCQAQLASSAVTKGSFAEIAVPWSKIAAAKPAMNSNSFLRFTVSTYYNRSPRSTTPPLDAYTSVYAMDILDRSTSRDQTIAAVADGQMDAGSTFDVHFDTNGPTPTYEPYSPLLITEVQADPLGNDSPGPTNTSVDSEYIEIYNPNNFAIDLSQYKIGNAVTRGSSKTMLKFKSGTIAAKGVVVVAKYKSRFLTGWQQRHPGQTFPGTLLDQSSDMTAYNYATGTTLSLDNAPSGTQTSLKEQVVLLDENDGFVDVVSYGNTATPFAGQVQINVPATTEGTSFERCPGGVDTNGGYNPLIQPPTNTDFLVRETVDVQTPGVACVGRPGVNMQIEKTGPAASQVGLPVRFLLSYSNIGSQPEPSGTVTVVDTLPAGLTFANVAGNAVPMPNSVSQDGKTLTWNLAAPAVGGVAGSIVMTATVDAGLGLNVPLINTASISSANEPTDVDTQLNNTASWTVTTLGPAVLDLSVSNQDKAPPGNQFGMTINYGNSGQDDAENTTISVDIPSGVKVISTTAPGATPNFTIPAGGLAGPASLTWSVGTLLSGANGSISIVGVVNANVTSGTKLQFPTKISSTTADPAEKSADPVPTISAEFIRVFVPITKR